MKALISKIEPRETGWRVAQVEPDNQIFPVADDLMWVDCEDNVKADQYWFDPKDNTIKAVPTPPPAPDQPTSNGTQTL